MLNNDRNDNNYQSVFTAPELASPSMLVRCNSSKLLFALVSLASWQNIIRFMNKLRVENSLTLGRVRMSVEKHFSLECLESIIKSLTVFIWGCRLKKYLLCRCSRRCWNQSHRQFSWGLQEDTLHHCTLKPWEYIVSHFICLNHPLLRLFV